MNHELVLTCLLLAVCIVIASIDFVQYVKARKEIAHMWAALNDLHGEVQKVLNEVAAVLNDLGKQVASGEQGAA